MPLHFSRRRRAATFYGRQQIFMPMRRTASACSGRIQGQQQRSGGQQFVNHAQKNRVA